LPKKWFFPLTIFFCKNSHFDHSYPNKVYSIFQIHPTSLYILIFCKVPCCSGLIWSYLIIFRGGPGFVNGGAQDLKMALMEEVTITDTVRATSFRPIRSFRSVRPPGKSHRTQPGPLNPRTVTKYNFFKPLMEEVTITVMGSSVKGLA